MLVGLIHFLFLLDLLFSLEFLLEHAQLIVKVILIDIAVIVAVEHLVHVVALVLELIHLVSEVVELVNIKVLHNCLLLLDYILHGGGLNEHKCTISMVFWILSEVKPT